MKVFVTNEAYRLVESRARNGGLRPGYATQLPNGGWHVKLSREVVLRIAEHKFPGESLSDVIVRVLTTKQ